MDTENTIPVEQSSGLEAVKEQIPAPETAATTETDANLEKSTSEGEITPEKQPETDKERNFRTLRENAVRYQRERDEAMARLAAIEEAKQAQNPEEDNSINLNPDDIVEGKHISKVSNEIKKLKAELNNYKNQSYVATTEIRLKTEFPDFDAVVTKENIETLKAMDPELAETIAANPNIYSKAKVTYNQIKRMGIVNNAYDADKAKAASNLAKPRPLASVNPQQGDSPLSKANAFANGLTDDLKKELWRDMQEAMKNR